jgi:uncharacterized protein YbcI
MRRRPVVRQQQTEESLQQRINDYLRGKPSDYASEESEEEIVKTLLGMLQKAEQDLKAAQERIDRIKWELAKSRS